MQFVYTAFVRAVEAAVFALGAAAMIYAVTAGV